MEDTTFTCEGTQAAGYIDGLIPEALYALSKGALGSPDEVQTEIDAMTSAVRNFWRLEPDQVMRDCSAYSARATEMEIHLHRVEGRNRGYTKLRTMEVVKLLTELDRQFKIASRQIEMRRQDIDLAR